IVDDDGPPEILVGDASVKEGDNGTTNAVFAVNLSAPSAFSVSVDYATADQTAQTPADYLATSGTLIFAPGETNKTVAVAVVGDTLYELDETFLVGLENPTNALIGRNPGVGTIIDDDAPPTLTISDAQVVEGNNGFTNAVFLVRLSAP